MDRGSISRMVKPVADRVALTIGRAVLRLVKEAAGVQLVQIEALKGEVIDQAEHLQQYGFASSPLPGAEAVVAAVGGARNHPIVLVIADRRYRPSLQPGEAILHDDQGQVIHISRDGVLVTTEKPITISTTGLFRVDANEVEIHGKVKVKIDAGGAGVTYTPTKTDDWRQGLPVVNHPPSPPEHTP